MPKAPRPAGELPMPLVVAMAGVVAALITSCQSGTTTSSRSDSAAPASAVRGQSSPAPTGGDCPRDFPLLGLTTDRSRYAAGDVVTITLTTTNPGPFPCIARPTDCSDAATITAASTTVWTSLAPLIAPSCPGAVHGPTLAPGTRVATTWRWDQCSSATWAPGPCIGPPGPGTFTVVGAWGQVDSPPATFALTAPGCSAADVTIHASVSSGVVPRGAQVDGMVTVQSHAEHSCVIRAGAVAIRHGADRIFTAYPCGSRPCSPYPAAVVIPAHGSMAYAFTWDGSLCAMSCPGPPPPPGSYTVDAGDGAVTTVTTR